MKRILAAGIVLAALSSATVLASADAATHDARPSAKAGAFTVTASVNKTEPLVDSLVKIKGSVKPAAPGSRVTLQIRYQDQNQWKTIDFTTLSAASTYKFKDKITSVRGRKYRVVKPAGPHRSAGHSDSIKVTVFGWRDLTQLVTPVKIVNFLPGPAVINGVTYPNSLLGGSAATGSVDYNLNRGCKLLDARYGLTDASSSTATTTLSVVTDNASRFSGTFGLTQSQQVLIDVTGVFRLTFNAASTPGGYAAVATPRVLCSF